MGHAANEVRPGWAFSRHFYDRPAVKNTVAKLVSRVRRPPYKTDTMEMDYGMWRGLSSIHCRQGRQIGEENTEPKVLRERFPTEYRVSNLPGSRAGRRINLATLRSVMQGWTDAMELVMALRQRYVEVLPSPAGRMPVYDTFIFSKYAVGFAAYLSRRGTRQLEDGEVPVPIANEVKLVAGMFMIVQHMLDFGEEPRAPDAVMTGVELYDYADQNGVFISPSGHVCAGSQSKITELLDCVVEGGDAYQPFGEAVSAVLHEAGSLDRALRYGFASLQLELTMAAWRSELLLYALRGAKRLEVHDVLAHARQQVGPTPGREQLLANRSRALGQILGRLAEARIEWPVRSVDVAEIRARVEDREARVHSGADFWTVYEELTDVAFEAAVTQQREINRVLGRPRDVQPSRTHFLKQICAFPH